MNKFDAVIIGAGAAGLFCAWQAGLRGRKVLIIDHAKTAGEKIRISGGGRCNFTNIHAGPANFISQNKRFPISALKRYRATDFIATVDAHGIAWHEKTLGQLFCDGSAKEIIAMLTNGVRDTGGTMKLSTSIEAITHQDGIYTIRTTGGIATTPALVIATGGKSIPKMGATGFGYQVASQFGIPVTPIRPALVPLTFTNVDLDRFRRMAGLSLDAEVHAGKTKFREGLLFTHRGLSGPSILQISSYWTEGDSIQVNLLPETNAFDDLRALRQSAGRQSVTNALATLLPKKLAADLTIGDTRNLADLSDKALRHLTNTVHGWALKPAGSEGYRTAEVTLGGVDTDALDSNSMMTKSQPGLYFIGEVVDVTGWLGGFNFQWAWSSGWAAAQTL